VKFLAKAPFAAIISKAEKLTTVLKAVNQVDNYQIGPNGGNI